MVYRPVLPLQAVCLFCMYAVNNVLYLFKTRECTAKTSLLVKYILYNYYFNRGFSLLLCCMKNVCKGKV